MKRSVDKAEGALETDVLVLGSGAAGLAGALVASVGGAPVVVVEKSPLIGGSSAMSGGCTWIPNHHHKEEIGLSDSADEALTYLRAVAPAGWAAVEEPLWRAFVEHAPEMLRFVEQHTPLCFAPGREPDPYAEAPGGKSFGRCLSQRPLPMSILGPWRAKLRPTTMMHSFNYDELADTRFFARPMLGMLKFGWRAAFRKLMDRQSMGSALIAGMLRGCLDRGCTILPGTPARRLIVETERVIGAECEREGRACFVRARRGVLIATGGFEWNAGMMARHRPGPVALAASPDTNTGDGQRMAEVVGAKLDRMDQALIYPTKEVIYEGRSHGAPTADLKLPHIILVNRRGKRFVNEVQVNIGLAFEARDPATGQPIHLPAWRIFDAQYAGKYRHALPARRKPPRFYQAATLTALAAAIAVDADGLAATVERFNRFARSGRDEDFGRGSHLWDTTTLGDLRQRPNPVLGTIEQPPFHAVPFYASYLGTKGGPRTNERGQVLRPDGSRIAGLYAAGNAMANPFGSKAVGAGTTLGPCLTWGYICGQNLLRENA